MRQAVNYAIDKRSLARLFGGLLEPGCNFLPPGMKGYQKIDPCPWGDPNAAPNVARAKALIKEAGVGGQVGHGLRQRRARAEGRGGVPTPTCSTRSA